MPFRLEREEVSGEAAYFSYRGIKHNFGVIDRAPKIISTGADLLACVSQRSYAPANEIRKVLEKFDAEMFINDKNLLMVRVQRVNVAKLNAELIEFGVDRRRATVIGIPENISLFPKNHGRRSLWEKLYGNQDIIF